MEGGKVLLYFYKNVGVRITSLSFKCNTFFYVFLNFNFDLKCYVYETRRKVSTVFSFIGHLDNTCMNMKYINIHEYITYVEN